MIQYRRNTKSISKAPIRFINTGTYNISLINSASRILGKTRSSRIVKLNLSGFLRATLIIQSSVRDKARALQVWLRRAVENTIIRVRWVRDGGKNRGDPWPNSSSRGPVTFYPFRSGPGALEKSVTSSPRNWPDNFKAHLMRRKIAVSLSHE